MNIVEYADRDMLAIDLANVLAGELENCLLTHDHASFAVPGGTTPGPVFDVLCAADLAWDRVHVMATDERWVPEGDVRSNARLIHERLLVNRASAADFMSFHGTGETLDATVTELNERMVNELPLSVLLLGMGPDMHCASLFPGAPELEAALASDAPPLMAQTPPTQAEQRVSLTGPILDGALSKHVVITGDDKLDALDRALSMPPEEAPINAVLDGTTIHWAA